MDNEIKKNLLDLNYNKNLQYKISTLIILFTYIIGVIIAFLTKQLKFAIIDMLFLSILSILVIGVGILFLNKFDYNLKKIPKEIKKLES